jgi:hypothetical protein
VKFSISAIKPFVASLVLVAGLAAPSFAQEGQAPTDTASAAYRQWKLEHDAWQLNYSQWKKRYAKWQEEQSRLDDGFLLSLGIGPSPMRVDARFSGGNVTNFPDKPPFPDVSLRGLGVAVDARIGWLVENDPYLKDYWYGDDELHDQLYLTFDLLTRSTPFPQWRFAQGDSTNENTFLRPVYVLDLIFGPGMTYLVYPYHLSFSSTIGFGLLGIQGENGSVRTQIGPAFSARIAQEWSVRENWRSGIAINYGIAQSINPRRVAMGVESYQENYRSYLFSIQWVNSFTPPKYRRGLPPSHPRQWDTNSR